MGVLNYEKGEKMINTLVIWEHELKKPEMVKNAVINFLFKEE